MIDKGCYVTLRPNMKLANLAMMLEYLGEGPYFVIDIEKAEVQLMSQNSTIILAKVATDYGDYRKVPIDCFVRTQKTKESVDWRQEGF